MKIYGYTEEERNSEEPQSSKLAEVTLVASPSELRLIAEFLVNSAKGMEERGTRWEHEHLSDAFKQFYDSPHFVVFNPEAQP